MSFQSHDNMGGQANVAGVSVSEMDEVGNTYVCGGK